MAKIKVKLQDGRVGTIDSSEFDANSMTQVNDQAPQPAQSTDSSIISGKGIDLQASKVLPGNDLVSGIINSAASPFIKTGQNIGGSVMELLRQPGLQASTKTVDQNTKEQMDLMKKIKGEKDPTKKKALIDQSRTLAFGGDNLRSNVDQFTGQNPLLSNDKLQQASDNPLGYVADQARQSAALPFYATGAGGFKEGALAGGMITQANSNNPTEIATGALAGGLLSKVIPFAFNRIFGKTVSDAAPTAGQDLIKNTSNVVNSGGSKEFIARTAGKDTAIPQSQVLLDEGILKHPTQTGRIQATSESLQKTGNELANTYKNSGVIFKSNDLNGLLDAKLNEMGYATKDINFIKSYVARQGSLDLKTGDIQVPAAKIWDAAKRLEINPPKILKSPESAAQIRQLSTDTARIMRGELTRQIPDTVPLNAKYSALKDYMDNGLPANPQGLDIKGGGVTGAISSGAKSILNPILNKAYDLSTAKEAPTVISNMLGKAGVFAGAGAASSQPQTPVVPTNNTNTSSNDSSIVPENTYVTGYSPEDLYSAYQDAKNAGDTTSASELKKMYEDETTYQKDHKPTQMQQTLKPAALAIDNVGKLIDKNITGPQNRVAKFQIDALGGAGVDQNIVSANQQLELAKQLVVRSLQGARMSDRDIKVAESYIPSITDTPETAKTKLTNLKIFLTSLNNQ